MKDIDTSTFDFPEIIGNDFLYVDKTDYVWNLVCRKKGEYFLSRPRRFGKSLLVSTLKAVFQGKRELFGPDGLHPNAAGAKVIAEAVFRTLCNNSGKESDEQEMK